jgi:hypothetical protein
MVIGTATVVAEVSIEATTAIIDPEVRRKAQDENLLSNHSLPAAPKYTITSTRPRPPPP